MGLQEKYQEAVNTANNLGARNVEAKEENGKFIFRATVPGADEKRQIWESIKQIGGENPADIMADITMDDSGNSGAHEANVSSSSYTVKSGDTLSKIAKEKYGDSGRYMDIFNANKDILSDPDKIQVGQELQIPG
ncbi:peptidoglycan-binding protein LysM [soil metagenome]